MAESKITPINREPARQPLDKRLYLTDDADETAHKVACVLRYLAVHHRYGDTEFSKQMEDDIELGRYVLLHDLATALDYAYETRAGEEVPHG